MAISFDLTEEQQLLVDTIAKFAMNELRKAAREAEETTELPKRLIETGWALGLVPSNIPEAYGGFGAHSALNGVLAAEHLAYGDLAATLAIMAPALFASPLERCGTEAQKTAYLPRFADEPYYPATAALIEPRIRFDPYYLHTTAEVDGDTYRLNGHKCFVPLAAEARLMLVYAREDDQTQAFIVERDTPGVTVGPRESNMGWRALPTYEVALADVRVPRENRLGGEGGCDFRQVLGYSKVGLAAMAVGVAKAAYEFAREYAKERVTFGEPIAQKQAIAFMLAEMALEIDAVRLMTWEAAWKLDKGQDATRECYLAKMTADDMALKVTDNAVQVLGGHGYIRDNPVEMWLRNARGFVTMEGMATA
ncbi:MAG: acyl-CoA dehydrogenase family protein [Chloroflexi bacterium]|nr:acyl-CoA dehydrogenase family protein [Chloroflexota bacterium]MBI3732344.1 acyl-CoA dehydrogenase family protein [Chloroflexota bacterium]